MKSSHKKTPKKTAPSVSPDTKTAPIVNVQEGETAPRSILCPETPSDLYGRVVTMLHRAAAVAQALDVLGRNDFEEASPETLMGLGEIMDGVRQELELFATDYANERGGV